MGTGTMTSNAAAIETKPLRTMRVSTARQRRIGRYPHRPRQARREGLCRPRTVTFERSGGNCSERTEAQPDV